MADFSQVCSEEICQNVSSSLQYHGKMSSSSWYLTVFNIFLDCNTLYQKRSLMMTHCSPIDETYPRVDTMKTLSFNFYSIEHRPIWSRCKDNKNTSWKFVRSYCRKCDLTNIMPTQSIIFENDPAEVMNVHKLM